jgi:DNA-binding NarL/FixJ family response regulator
VNNDTSGTNRAERPEPGSGSNRPAISQTISQSTNQPPSSVRVMLADPAELMHLAVRALIADDPMYSRLATATNVTDAQRLVLQTRPLLLICEIDIGRRSGIQFCRWVRSASPPTRIVILTNRNEPLLATAALAAGAIGYLLKSSPEDVLRASLRQAATGETVIDDRLGKHYELAHEVDVANQLGFSRREREVLGELILGQDNRSIAATLSISEETVKSHLKSIFRKLGARDRAQALALAIGTATAPSQRSAPGAGTRQGG